MRDLFALLGRIALAALFIREGYSKIVGFDATVAYIAAASLPLPQVAAVIAIVVEFGGGLALALGLKARWAALALAAYCLATALLFHYYWALAPDQRLVQAISFWKDISIMGGMLMVVASGAGALSFARR